MIEILLIILLIVLANGLITLLIDDRITKLRIENVLLKTWCEHHRTNNEQHVKTIEELKQQLRKI